MTIRLAEMGAACLPAQAGCVPTWELFMGGRELDFAAARFHFFEGVREIREANLFGYKVVSEDIAAANGFERFANETRRVMERGDELDLRIMDGGGLDFHARAGRQTAKEVHNAAASDHGQRLLPGGGIAGGLDHGIGAALVFGQISDGGNDIATWVTLMVATAPMRRATSSGATRRASAITRKPRRESMRTYFSPMGHSQLQRRCLRCAFHLVNAAQHASQRLDQRRAAIIDGVRYLEHIFHDDTAGDAHVFGVRTIVKEQVFAKVFLGTTAVKAAQARCRIGGDYAEPRRHRGSTRLPTAATSPTTSWPKIAGGWIILA